MADVTFPAAAAAGLLSFLSPCVLPLVPPYLTYLAGVSMEDLEIETRSRARRDILLSSILFVLGFTTVFVALGATASAFGGVLREVTGVFRERVQARPAYQRALEKGGPFEVLAA